MLKRLLAWLRRDEYVKAAVEGAAARAYLEGYGAGHTHGFKIGHAAGELKGRSDLAQELETAFGVDGHRDLTIDDVHRIRVSQKH